MLAHGPIVAVKTPNDVPAERLQAQSWKMLYPNYPLKQWESVHFEWKYACPLRKLFTNPQKLLSFSVHYTLYVCIPYSRKT